MSKRMLLWKKGKIIYVSKTYKGSIRTFKIHKNEDPIHLDKIIYADSTYQELDKLYTNTKTPIKKLKIKP